VQGEAIITIETTREAIHRAAEMRLTRGIGGAGFDGADFDAAADHNYALANDKVLWRTTVALDPSGRFSAALPRDMLDHPQAAWVKVYVSATDAAGLVVDAAQSARISRN
jgi:hypothetical protein